VKKKEKGESNAENVSQVSSSFCFSVVLQSCCDATFIWAVKRFWNIKWKLIE